MLYVSRLEPENNAHVVIDAYRSVPTDLPLAIVGDAPYASELHRGAASARTTHASASSAPSTAHGYQVLRSHATAYVQATEVGGTHPALVEAMGFGNAIVANDVPEHRETLADAGLFYKSTQELAAALTRIVSEQGLDACLRESAHRRAREHFGWDAIADAYESWFRGLVGRTGEPPGAS